jgi:eukaryotic-like serine/threonine-protein kinase
VFKFLTHRHFLINLLVAIALTVFLIWGTLRMLGVITKHGEYLTVPNVKNKSTVESIKLLESKGFNVIIQDSVYTDTLPRGTVLKQFPEGNSTVKVNRNVLLTVNRVTLPLVDVPSLVSKSKDYAIELLGRSHLTLGDTTFKSSYMMGAVIEYRYKGAILSTGAKVPWGEKIDLVIGSGLSLEQFMVPVLTGMTVREAKEILEAKGLQLASIVPQKGQVIKDTLNAYVNQQNPPARNEDNTPNYIRAGQVMDLWIGNTNSPVAIYVDSAALKLADSLAAAALELEKPKENSKEKSKDKDKDNK